MNTVSNPSNCPKCGSPIPPEAPQGLCPQCVFAGASAATETGLPATATAEIPSLERVAAAFPQLEIRELIGRGGMGFVFKARQPHLDRLVALKLLPDKLARDPQFAERFNREGRVLARLNHPNIVGVFDFGQTGGFYFLLMEYVDGVNLRQAMRAGRFSPVEALAIVPKICEALQYAHDQGVLHRDIKPENILLDARGRVKIADFGIAKIVGEEKPDVSLTATGAALGTPHYMAPEQFEKPATVDHRADIYSLGVVFYEMLTGELPIGRFSAPSARTPVDPRVDDVVMRTLEKEREKRFQSAGEMKTSVEHLTEAGAGSFKAAPAKTPGGGGGRSAGGVVPTPPKQAGPAESPWSIKAIWGAVLAGISFLPIVALLVVLAFFGPSHGYLGGWEIILIIASVTLSLPALAGTILGWMGLNDIRTGPGRLRGLPLAVFAALAWPTLVLLGVGVVIPLKLMSPGNEGVRPWTAARLLPMMAGTITFAIWSIHAATRWGSNQPASERRGKLKWVFLALMTAGLGVVALSALNQVQRNRAWASANEDRRPTPPAALADANTPPWIRFTFTAVELREVKGVRWLAIDYLDDVHGGCEKSFSWESSIPGFKAETRATEFATDAKDSSPSVRHQRIEYRMPDSSPRDQLERLRDNLEKTIQQKSFRLDLTDDQVPLLLFELPGVEGGSLTARIKVAPPLEIPASRPAASISPAESLALTITRATIEPENRKLRVFFDVEESSTLGIKAESEVVIKKGGANYPAPLPGTIRRMDTQSHVAEWVLPEFFDASRLTNAQWQVNFNHAGRRFEKRPGQAVTLVVLGQHATVGREDNWEHQLLLRVVAVSSPPKTGGPKNVQPSAFGPVFVRTLSFSDSLQDGFLDLDTSRRLTPPTDIAALFRTPYGKRVEWEQKSDPRAMKMREWLRDSGANLMASGRENPERLEMHEGVAIPPPWTGSQRVSFDEADPAVVAKQAETFLRALLTNSAISLRLLRPGSDTAIGQRQDTFQFMTRTGTIGVLQILNVEDNPPGVKIRYKLVQSDTSKPADRP